MVHLWSVKIPCMHWSSSEVSFSTVIEKVVQVDALIKKVLSLFRVRKFGFSQILLYLTW